MQAYKLLILKEADFKSEQIPAHFDMGSLKDGEVLEAFCTSELVFVNNTCVKDRLGVMGEPVIAPVILIGKVYSEREILKNEVERLEEEKCKQLQEHNRQIDDLLDDIGQFRANQIALKAVIGEVADTLADKEELTDGEIDEAVRMLRHARDFY